MKIIAIMGTPGKNSNVDVTDLNNIFKSELEKLENLQLISFADNNIKYIYLL